MFALTLALLRTDHDSDRETLLTTRFRINMIGSHVVPTILCRCSFPAAILFGLSVFLLSFRTLLHHPI